MNAAQTIREARRLERNLGTTVYQQVTNTTTGNEILKPVATIGLPAAGAGLDTMSLLTTLGLIATTGFGIKTFAENRLKAELAGKEELRKKRKLKMLAGASLAFGSVLVAYPFTVDLQTLQNLNPMNTDVIMS